MTPLLMLLLVAGAEPTREVIELKTPTGVIHGTLDLPTSKGPWLIAIIHAGSGPTDRDGNNPQMKNNSLKLLGEALQAEGIAVLRFDKRGIAASAKALGKVEELTIDHYADDVVAWVKLLRSDKRFSKVAFIGHSEGSIIGGIAAPNAKFDAYVSLCGPGRRFDELMAEQVAKDDAKLGAQTAVIMQGIAKGEEPAEIPKLLMPLFPKSVRPYLRSTMAHDVAKQFGAISCPTLIVSGSTDIQVAEADATALAKANPKAKSVRVTNMTHVLKEFDKTHKLLQLATYMDSNKPLHPKLAPAIVQFLNESTKSPTPP